MGGARTRWVHGPVEAACVAACAISLAAVAPLLFAVEALVVLAVLLVPRVLGDVAAALTQRATGTPSARAP
ncbi:MAG: hypothetical protein ACYDCK_09320 [Thermoplasmatota archaeon]